MCEGYCICDYIKQGRINVLINDDAKKPSLQVAMGVYSGMSVIVIIYVSNINYYQNFVVLMLGM